MHHLIADRPLLFIAHNSSDIVHWGEVAEGQNISTGQPLLETFELADRDLWVARANELGVPSEQLLPTEGDDLHPGFALPPGETESGPEELSTAPVTPD